MSHTTASFHQLNLFFVNLERFAVRSKAEIETIRQTVEATLAPLGHPVHAIVNYDNFNILSDLVDDYVTLINDVTPYYEGVTRYTTSAFLRMKMGDELKKRNLAPYIYESPEEAHQALKKTQT